jgi:hypothetical protein
MKSQLTRSLRKQKPMKIERFHMTLKKQILSTYEKILFSTLMLLGLPIITQA